MKGNMTQSPLCSVPFAVMVSCRKPWAPQGGIVQLPSEKCRHCGGGLSPADSRNRHTGSSLPRHKRCCNRRMALQQSQLLPESPAQDKGVPHQSRTAMALTGAHDLKSRNSENTAHLSTLSKSHGTHRWGQKVSDKATS